VRRMYTPPAGLTRTLAGLDAFSWWHALQGSR
jgi:hypothetical protein